jgi:hypothetical protein
VQVQLVREDDSPWSNWINEYAVVKPASEGVPAAFRLWNQEDLVHRYRARK